MYTTGGGGGSQYLEAYDKLTSGTQITMYAEKGKAQGGVVGLVVLGLAAQGVDKELGGLGPADGGGSGQAYAVSQADGVGQIQIGPSSAPWS